MINAHAGTVATIRAANKSQHGIRVNHYTALLAAPSIHNTHKPEIAHAWAREIRAMLGQVG